MTSTFTASIDVKPMAKSLKNYQRKKLPAVIQQALNRAIKGVVTDAVQAPRGVVKERINMKTSEIRKRLETTKAQKGSGFASVKVKGKRPPNLITFMTSTQIINSRAETFKGRKWKGKRRIPGKGAKARGWEKTKTYNKTFIAKMQKGKKIVVKRVGAPGSGRQKLKAVFGPSLQSVFRRKTRTGESPVKILGRLGKGRLEKEIAQRLKSIQLK